MSKCHKSLYIVAISALSTCLLGLHSGCKPAEQIRETEIKETEQQETQVDQEQLARAAFAEISKLESELKLDQAMTLTEASIDNQDFSKFKVYFFNKKIDLMIQQEKVVEAEELLVSEIKKNPAVANSLGVLINHYNSTQAFDKSIALCNKMLVFKETLSDQILANILRSKLANTLELNNSEAAKVVLDEIMTLVEESSSAIAVIQPSLERLIRNKKDFTTPLELAEYVQSKNATDDNYKKLDAVLNIQCAITSEKWEQLKPAYLSCIEYMQDPELVRMMHYIFNSLAKAKMNDLLKKCAYTGIYQATNKPTSTDLAAGKWIDICFAEDKNSLPANIRTLQTTTVSANKIASIFNSYFYKVTTDLPMIKELCKIGPDLITKCTDEKTKNNLKVKLLDGAFIIEDYDLAISMLEQGIPDKDEAWHAMSLPKVKAHRAQALNQPREAVKYFREFMQCWIDSEKEEESDPTSGVTYSKEWILARNANRIAGILKSIPDQAEAAKALDEAKTYFKVAIEKAKDDEVSLKLVTEEAAKVQ